jgi:hypothetical protein
VAEVRGGARGCGCDGGGKEVRGGAESTAPLPLCGPCPGVAFVAFVAAPRSGRDSLLGRGGEGWGGVVFGVCGNRLEIAVGLVALLLAGMA